MVAGSAGTKLDSSRSTLLSLRLRFLETGRVTGGGRERRLGRRGRGVENAESDPPLYLGLPLFSLLLAVPPRDEIGGGVTALWRAARSQAARLFPLPRRSRPRTLPNWRLGEKSATGVRADDDGGVAGWRWPSDGGTATAWAASSLRVTLCLSRPLSLSVFSSRWCAGRGQKWPIGRRQAKMRRRRATGWAPTAGFPSLGAAHSLLSSLSRPCSVLPVFSWRRRLPKLTTKVNRKIKPGLEM